MTIEQLQRKKSPLVSDFLLLTSAIAFFAFYFIQGVYVRPAYDDVLFFAEVKNNGVFESLHNIYFTWSGRWTGFLSFFLLLSTSSFQNIHFFFAIYYLLTISVLTYSVFSILLYTSGNLFYSKVNPRVLFAFTGLFIACFYFFTFQNIEVWGWVFGSFFYLQGIVFLLLGIAILLKKKNTFLDFMLISFSFIYVGGCNEIYSLITIVLLIFWVAYEFLKSGLKFSNFKKNKIFKGLIIAFASIIFSSAISFSAPGNQIRRGDNCLPIYQESGSVFSVNDFIRQKKYYVAVGISSLWIILGMKLRNNAVKIMDGMKIKKLVFASSLPLILSIVIIVLFKILLLHNQTLPLRAYTFSGFAFGVASCFLFLITGYRYAPGLTSYRKFVLTIILPSIVLLFLSLNFYNQFNYARNYALRYDNMIKQFIKISHNNQQEPLLLNDLPDSGTLLKFDITNNYYTMDPLREILNIHNKIRVVKE